MSELEKIEKVIQGIRPLIQQDGGDVSFVSYTNGVVTVALQGACEHCPISNLTLKFGIEKQLKEIVPEVIEVVAV
ncbi:MAG: hypothetical protein A3H59_01070 [Candidatus Jacksonbacteria bacterium RIFCSPLOWO2_02_FULL_43_9]|nr:MAG: Nitrogen-fixing NifU domain protein [Parcubacteria group bacterium GW2011_GWA2_43_13]OGY68559.1 MAG: hypothetical protein A3B94_00695 [Candidatus Jacksonbacteria bacterium RIFCSPHIGHO2_02_FULL_43_10]OGY70555.1 MAG: hypothetical protein A2986_02490 [Candidatus Jacksonbacteria bacterium RIFCSPLOWO2_01_FULL_44_13]OGY71898.1 MAG: hypothetical protein A3H59_01070 [Candidatus Jacksonbacteria bacterium RIFCSPLOWO2_02_FULL_43_9]HAZ16330.1 hypothetical protein [Candidatus Jacksonbacteria bacteri